MAVQFARPHPLDYFGIIMVLEADDKLLPNTKQFPSWRMHCSGPRHRNQNYEGLLQATEAYLSANGRHFEQCDDDHWNNTLLTRDAILTRYMPSSCVCLSDTLKYCIKTAKRRITQIMPHDSPGL